LIHRARLYRFGIVSDDIERQLDDRCPGLCIRPTSASVSDLRTNSVPGISGDAIGSACRERRSSENVRVHALTADATTTISNIVIAEVTLYGSIGPVCYSGIAEPTGRAQWTTFADPRPEGLSCPG
jgi:hypothetical protein